MSAYTVQLIRWDSPAAVEDLTQWVTQLQWSETIRRPWGGIQLSLQMPDGDWGRVPYLGDWIIVRDAADLTVALGYVDTRNTGMQVEQGTGHAKSFSVNVGCIPPLEVLGRAQTHVSPFLGRSVGTVQTMQEWATGAWAALLKMANSSAATALRIALPDLGAVDFPPALGGIPIGSAHFPVTNQALSAIAPARAGTVEPVPGITLQGLSTPMMVRGTTALDLLMGAFVPDAHLVEFFPSLEPGVRVNAAGRAISAQPTLVYRIAPFQASSIAGVAEATLNVDGFFQSGFTWDAGLKLAPVWSRNEVYGLTMQAGDGDHVNMTTCGLPWAQDHEMRYWTNAGLPVMDATSIRRRGARMYQPGWPFFSPKTTDADVREATILAGMKAIARRSAAFFINQDRFERGQVRGKFNPKIRHGLPLFVELPTGAPADRLTCYVEGVTHTITVDEMQGTIREETVVNYSRGLIDSRDRSTLKPPTRGIGGA